MTGEPAHNLVVCPLSVPRTTFVRLHYKNILLFPSPKVQDKPGPARRQLIFVWDKQTYLSLCPKKGRKTKSALLSTVSRCWSNKRKGTIKTRWRQTLDRGTQGAHVTVSFSFRVLCPWRLPLEHRQRKKTALNEEWQTQKWMWEMDVLIGHTRKTAARFNQNEPEKRESMHAEPEPTQKYTLMWSLFVFCHSWNMAKSVQLRLVLPTTNSPGHLYRTNFFFYLLCHYSD